MHPSLESSSAIRYTVRMRIGLSTAAYYGRLETDEAAAHIAGLGLSCCEVFLETYREYTPGFGEVVRRNLKATRAVSIHAKTQHFESDLMGQSSHQREDAFAMFEQFLQAGQALGAGICVYHGPANLRGGAPPLERWQPGIADAISLARTYGIDFCWETVSWCHLNSPSRVRQFMALWPSLRFVLDIKQVFQLSQQPGDYIEAMGSALRHVHVLDHDANGILCLPGQGCVDFAMLAHMLREAGYQGDIIVEPYASQVTSDQAVIDSIRWLEELFG